MNAYNILVVEDEKDIRDAIGIYLGNQGYNVFKASNGIDGLEILEKQEVHLAIVDVMMPKMDGLAFTMKLREKFTFPVIILSAKFEDIDKIMGLNIGADDYPLIFSVSIGVVYSGKFIKEDAAKRDGSNVFEDYKFVEGMKKASYCIYYNMQNQGKEDKKQPSDFESFLRYSMMNLDYYATDSEGKSIQRRGNTWC